MKLSTHEILTKNLIGDIIQTVDETPLSITNSKIIIEKCYKILDKCKELRISRDKWSERCKTAERKVKLTKELIPKLKKKANKEDFVRLKLLWSELK